MAIVKERCKSIPFLLISLVIGAISAYDNTLNLIFMKTLPYDEQNPFASWIIQNHGVEGLIYLKAATTGIASLIMVALSFIKKYRLALIPVLFFQLALFYYLTFYAPTESGIERNDSGNITTPFSYYWDFITKGEVPNVCNAFSNYDYIAR
jgi:hypothetical protein